MPNTDTPKAVKPPRKWLPWYEYITPFLGIKWGATVTLVGYVWIYQRSSEGLKAAAIIVTLFLALEWAQMAWCEFKRRANQ
jgi:hypothetical protein